MFFGTINRLKACEFFQPMLLIWEGNEEAKKHKINHIEKKTRKRCGGKIGLFDGVEVGRTFIS